ncbi:hypothetical protein ES332_D01G179800v1 [Gossypium tomentosum]|uniref:Uncharacterized protein n=1 Tax=Gossypium tomentosum TaxID=34277 RepID=A0A5D2MAK3_GOSTO|nr:hypothetical protein ES332_D01G179800v1 [Gossypium tomentosum]
MPQCSKRLSLLETLKSHPFSFSIFSLLKNPKISSLFLLFQLLLTLKKISVVYPNIFFDYQSFLRALLQSFEFQIRAPVVAWRSFKTLSATEKVLERKIRMGCFPSKLPVGLVSQYFFLAS